MSLWTLILRGLRFHARSHLGTLLGIGVGSAVLTGALLVGDSVRGSLRELALARLGRTQVALAGGDRFFRSALANDLASATSATVVPVIHLEATAATPEETGRANRVQVLGVDERFWRLANTPPSFPSPGEGEVLLNARLMRQLGVRPGDVINIQASRPSALSRETPLSPQEDAALRLRLTVVGEVPAETLGSFSLRPSQVPPFNAFVHLASLQERLELPGRANVLLGSGSSLTAETANLRLRDVWQLADAELDLRVLPDRPVVELRTSRVFLEPAVATAAVALSPAAEPILTYFVNALDHDQRSTPYSMVTAADLPFLPPDLGTNGLVLNQWTAEDLEARPGDEVTLRYYALSTGRRLEERSARFQLRAVVPLKGEVADRELMPRFPGIEKADSTHDWDPSLPVSMAEIRPKDEDYWREHKGTPKAFVSLAAGQALWTNRFGDLTAIRFPAEARAVEARRDQLATELRQALDPPQFGLQFEPTRDQALASVAQSQDFGGLFIGFSLFLIVAALLLVALLFQFGVERRAEEVGTLLAVGFRPSQVRRILLGEAAGLAVVGSLLGLALGIVYARAMIHGLATLWRDAVGTSALAYHGSPTTLSIGALSGAIVAVATIAVALRKQARQPARVLLAGHGFPEETLSASNRGQGRRSWTALACLGAGLLLVVQALFRGETSSAGTFFGAGALALIGGLAAAGWMLVRLNALESNRQLSLLSLSVRNASRRRGRSLAVLGLLASGSFLVAAIGVFRLDAIRDAGERPSGTGGFVLMGEATIPLVHDLNTRDGLEFFALDPTELEGVSFVPMRVRDGDEASCLNLNRAREPRLLGVDPALLARRNAFTFAKVAPGLDRGTGWDLLRTRTTSDDGAPVIPAIGDLNSILWAMGRKLGDELDYTDERGRAFRVRIVGAVANSILQGNLLIDEAAFVDLFPSEPGFRMLLVDAPTDRTASTATTLTRALSEAGVEFTSTTERLNAFNAVQNTYLGTFQLLGGLGLILGSIGLGVVVLRNVLERRGELALLLAVGFRRPTLGRIVLSEHTGLLAGGLALGVVAAGIAVLPSVLSPSAHVPWLTLTVTLGGVLLSGWVWTWLATRAALRGQLLDGLRDE